MTESGMGDRILAGLSAGLLAVGMTAAAFVGAGAALAEDGAGPAGGADGTSQSSESTGRQADSADNANSVDSKPNVETSDHSDAEDAETDDKDRGEIPDNEISEESDDSSDSEISDGHIADQEVVVDAETPSRSTRATVVTNDDSADFSDAIPTISGVQERDNSVGLVLKGAESTEDEASQTRLDSADDVQTTTPDSVEDKFLTTFDAVSTPATARVTMAAPEQQIVAPMPSLIRVIGTLFFTFFDMVGQLAAGPPSVPVGSSVRVGRSMLEIDVGDGYTSSTDWYFPDTDGPPTRLIYFQHGAYANAGFYNVTAAELAERNNAIVVAPSITSNLFAADGAHLSADPMHAGVAKLFEGDRAALLASAQAAGQQAGVEVIRLPQQFVMVGHSGGGQLAVGAAGYYVENALENDRPVDIVGVLLLDSTAVGGFAERALDKLPDSFPVYTIAAQPHPLNTFGDLGALLVRKRDGFVGVQLVDGTHSDGYRTSNTLVQALVGLVTGPSKPQNVEAVHVLASGWFNDWFGDSENDAAGIYGGRGELIVIPTTAGQAQAHVLPVPGQQTALLKLLQDLAGLSALLNLLII